MNAADLQNLLSAATRGPWQVFGQRHSGDLKIGKNTRLHFVGPDDDGLAAVFFDMQTGKGLPDARLIALAPDLARRVIAAEKLAEAVRRVSFSDNGIELSAALSAWEATQ